MKSLILSLLFCTSVLAYEGSVPWDEDVPEYPANEDKLQQIDKCVNILYGSHTRNDKDYDKVFLSFCEELTAGYIVS